MTHYLDTPEYCPLCGALMFWSRATMTNRCLDCEPFNGWQPTNNGE